MLRRERRKSIMLAVIAAVFVVAGMFMIAAGEVLVGVIAVVFFGSGLVVGVSELLRPGRGLSVGVVIIGALGFAVAGGLLIAGSLFGQDALGRRSYLALPVGIIAIVFFGGGAVLLAATEMRRRRRAGGETGDSTSDSAPRHPRAVQGGDDHEDGR